jgi:predicted amidophosphoribosyltransferase
MTLHTILGASRLVRVDVLEKLSDEKQSLRSAAMRREIQHEMHLANPMLVEGKDLLLFDDIVTTGSSMRASSGLLRENARSLTHVCIAIHPNFLKSEEKGRGKAKKAEDKSAFNL